MKNQGSMTIPKEQNKCLVTNHKKRKFYKLPNKKFKVIILRKHGELQKTTDN